MKGSSWRMSVRSFRRRISTRSTLRKRLHRFGGLISFFGITILISTFIVRDAFREHQKDLVASLEATKNMTNISQDDLRAIGNAILTSRILANAPTSQVTTRPQETPTDDQAIELVAKAFGKARERKLGQQLTNH